MQIDPIKPKLKPPRSKLLKLNCDVLLSKFGFKFSLRRYNSAFHLTYSMILNLIRVEGAEPEALMRQGGH